MNIHVNFKHLDPSEQLRQYAEKKIEKLAKYCPSAENIEVFVVLSVDKYRHNAEVAIKGQSLHLSAQEESEDMYKSIDMVTEKIETQLRKHASKAKDKQVKRTLMARTDILAFEEGRETTHHNIVRSDSFEPKPMLVGEAAQQLNSAKSEFIVFINATNDKVNVLYKLKNGDFGLIDPDA